MNRRVSQIIRVVFAMIGVMVIFQSGITGGKASEPEGEYVKSALGLMPPAYTLGSDAPAGRAARASGLFAGYEVVATGSWPEAVAAGDWNADGLMDAALSTAYDDDASYDHSVILINQDGAGGLAESAVYAAGSNPNVMVAGDLNHDNRQDVAVININQDTLSIFYQQAGSGFDASVTYPTGSTPDALAIGDFNADLLFDVAVSHANSQYIAIYFQERAGGFTPPVQLGVASAGFTTLKVGDLNSDMKDDLVLLRGAGFDNSQVAVFLQGEAGLLSPYFLTATTGGFLPHGLALGDVSGDGRDDIVVTAGGNMPNAHVNVFVQDENGEVSGTPAIYAAYHLPEAVEIGDVNHDGLNDVVVVHAGWVAMSVYLQTSGGGLAAYVQDTLPYNDSYSGYALRLADINNDGGLDVLVATHSAVAAMNGLAVLRNLGQAPTTIIDLPVNASYINPLDVYQIAGVGSTSGASVTVSIDRGVTWQAATGDLSWLFDWTTPLEDGGYFVIQSKITDSTGKVESYPSEARVILDRGVPTGSFVINDDALETPQVSVVLTIQAQDTLSGVCKMQFRNAGEDWSSEWYDYSPEFAFELIYPAGLKTVEGRFMDCAGNISEVASDDITLIGFCFIPMVIH